MFVSYLEDLFTDELDARVSKYVKVPAAVVCESPIGYFSSSQVSSNSRESWSSVVAY